MSELDRRKILIIADMLENEINMMCATDSLKELDNMAYHALRNIIKLQEMRHEYLIGKKEEE